MKNRGFTLIEIIGAIVILGIIAIIAFATYTNSLKGFRDNYYADTTRTLEKAGKEFFSDNRNYRPTKILNAQEVNASVLQSKDYINEIVDYNGDSCSERSYVMVVKEGKDDYSYHGCLICEGDNFDNTKDDLYCDRTWLDPTKVTYGLGSLDDIYIYKGTSRDELRDLLELPVSYVREDEKGNILATRVGLKEGGDPTMVPNDIDVVNTDVLGDYYVTYEYGTQTGKRKVIIYENKPPVITYRKQNIVATSLSGDTKVETTTYGEGEWAQSIIVNLNSQSYDDSSLTTSRFQWNKDGRWEDFCTSDPCERKISEEMNQAIQFRIVDSKGHISRLTAVKQFQIDNTKPKCTLEMPDTTVGGTRFNHMGDNSWYVSNNLIRFASKDDQRKSDNLNLVSGIIRYNIQISTATLDRNKTIDTTTHTQDAASIKYIGYVEDKAENFNTCETVVFKKDATSPNCSITQSGTKGTNDWYVTNVGYEITEHTDNLSGVYTYGFGSYTGSHSATHTTDTASVTYTGYIKDNAGNTNTCTTTFKRDATKPNCAITQTGTKGTNDWYITNVGYEITTHTDNLSEVYTYGLGSYTGAHSATQTTDTTGVTYTGYIKDNAGNTNTCTTTFKRDTTAPVCGNWSGESTDWTSGNRTISIGCSDATSNCVNSSYSTTISSGTVSTQSISFTLIDNAGNTKKCSKTAYVYVDKDAPSCSVTKSNTYKKAGVTTTVDCTDSGSGIKKCDSGATELTNGSYEYSVEDNVGHKNKCSTTVYAQIQERTKSCSSGKTCTSSGCGTTTCSSTCSGTVASNGGSCCSKGTSSCSQSFGQLSCTCSWTCNKTCTSISVCGCDSWGDYSSWENASSCSEGESSDHGTKTDCRTIYY